MMRCLNCGISVRCVQRHNMSTLTLPLQVRLARWVNNQVPLDAFICNLCYNLLNTEQADNERLLGHKMVCRGCGISVRGLRFYEIPADSHLLPIISQDNYQNVATIYACRACWTRANRVTQNSSRDLQENVEPAMPHGSSTQLPPLSQPVVSPPQLAVQLPHPARVPSDLKIEKNTHQSNLAACWKSATEEEQHDDQLGYNHPALSDTADDIGFSDDDNIQEPPPPPQLNLHTAQICRVCLALDVKMFDLRDTELKTMFHFTTGITFDENEGSKLGSLICWECAARLKAASKFRSKALFSDALLQGLINKGEQMQKQYFEAVKKEAGLISPTTLSVTGTVHIVEIEDQNNMTQLVQSGDDDEPSLSENDETVIKDEIKDEHSEMDLEGDVDIKTEIEDDPTCLYTGEENRTKILEQYPLDSTSSIEESINSGYSRPLLEIGHTSLRSDSTSSQDYDDQISKTLMEKTITKSKIVPKQNIDLKRSKLPVSHDHIQTQTDTQRDSEDGIKKKKIKNNEGTSKKVSCQKLARKTQVF